jgi:crossover junction endodeoxyribonuclease RusA
VLRVELDFPAPELFPNRSRGKHWTTTHKAKTEARETAFWKTKSCRKPVLGAGEVELMIIFEMPDRRHRDADNCLAAAKSALDGFASALGVDDKRFNPITIVRRLSVKPGKMIVDIKEIQ